MPACRGEESDSMVVMPMGSRRAARSRCGVYDCSDCDLYRAEKCPGCASGNLRLRRDGDDLCPVYECVGVLGIAGCRECSKERCTLSGRARLKCQLRVRFGGMRPAVGFLRRLEVARGGAAGSVGRVSGRSADRLCGYLGVLAEYERRNVSVVSSHQLAQGVGVRGSLVRRDLATLGGLGTPGRGYEVGPVAAAIRARLDLERPRPAIWLGVTGAIDWPSAVDALRAVNCSLIGIFDNSLQGTRVNTLIAQPLSRAPSEARRTRATVALVGSEQAAQPELLERLADAGVRGILNLTPVRIELPSRVVVEQCDVGSQILRLISRLGGD